MDDRELCSHSSHPLPALTEGSTPQVVDPLWTRSVISADTDSRYVGFNVG